MVSIPACRLRRFLIPPLILAVATTCERGPTDPPVSDTEIWRLELEQIDDGTEATYPRRGTVNLLLRLNHTTTPDGTCAGTAVPNATTFLASVEARSSRLQRTAGGSASGTWNCFGFAAEVRLDDGTNYHLSSEQPFEHYRSAAPASDTEMLTHTWVSGLRRGVFLLAPDSQFTYAPFDSHLDVVVQNRHDRAVSVGLGTLAGARTWRHRDVRHTFSDSFDPLLRSEVVAVGSHTFSWPVQPGHRWTHPEWDPSRYEIFVSERLDGIAWRLPGIPEIWCFLGAERRDRVELIVHHGLRIECGEGWIGSMDLRVAPYRRLFLQPGESDTLDIRAEPADTVFVQSSHAALQATVRRTTIVGATPVSWFDGTLVVGTTTSTPRTEHGVILRARRESTNTEAELVIPVEVYELATAVTPGSIPLAPGETGTATVRLAKVGLLGLDVRLEVPVFPPDVFLVPPVFSPAVMRGDSSTLTLRLEGSASPGEYPLTICAVIVGDPAERCHRTQIDLVVTAPPRNSPPIAANDSVTVQQGSAIDIPVLANDSDPDGESLSVARVGVPTSGVVTIDPAGQLVRFTPDPQFVGTARFTYVARDERNAESNEATVTVVVLASGSSGYDLRVVKTSSRGSVTAGDTVVFTLVASNLGPGAPLGAAVRDLLPSSLVHVADDGAGAYNPGNGIWSLGPLPAGESRTLRITARVHATSTNTAVILSESARDTNATNNASSSTVTVP